MAMAIGYMHARKYTYLYQAVHSCDVGLGVLDCHMTQVEVGEVRHHKVNLRQRRRERGGGDPREG